MGLATIGRLAEFWRSCNTEGLTWISSVRKKLAPSHGKPLNPCTKKPKPRSHLIGLPRRNPPIVSSLLITAADFRGVQSKESRGDIQRYLFFLFSYFVGNLEGFFFSIFLLFFLFVCVNFWKIFREVWKSKRVNFLIS